MSRSHPLWALTVARVKEFAREPGAVFWTFGFPVLLTIALGIAFRETGPAERAVAVVEGPAAASTARTLDADAELRAIVLPAGEAERRLRRGQVELVVEPSVAGVVYRYDRGRPEALALQRLADDVLQEAAGRVDPLPSSERPVETPGARYVDWLVPGLLGLQLLSGSLWGIAWAIVQARQKKLLKRLVATPMRRRDYLLAFLIARLVPLVVEVPLLFGFAYLVFGVRIHGSLAAVGLLALAGAVSFAGLGLLCASRSQNTETASGLVNLVTLPMFVLSGVFFPATRFPELLQGPIALLPLTALNDAMRAVVNEGAALAETLPELAILGAWGALSFGLALRIFRWT